MIALRLIPWAAALIALVPGHAHAVPQPWQLGFQPAVTPIAQRIDWLHDMLLVLITLISLFVLGLLGYVMWRFRESANPVPSRNTHNTLVEIVWTVVPVVILVIIAIPSFRLLYYVDRAQDASMTVKVTGHQWYWSYEYPDNGNFGFDSYYIQAADLKPGQHRLLDVDNRVVVPINTTIRVLITSQDVMHAWYMPPFGIQTYATPGRHNELWMRIEKPGVYYGQCNQICGVNHGFMPISVEAVTPEQFEQWTTQAKQKFARADQPVAVASHSLGQAR